MDEKELFSLLGKSTGESYDILEKEKVKKGSSTDLLRILGRFQEEIGKWGEMVEKEKERVVGLEEKGKIEESKERLIKKLRESEFEAFAYEFETRKEEFQQLCESFKLVVRAPSLEGSWQIISEVTFQINKKDYLIQTTYSSNEFFDDRGHKEDSEDPFGAFGNGVGKIVHPAPSQSIGQLLDRFPLNWNETKNFSFSQCVELLELECEFSPVLESLEESEFFGCWEKPLPFVKPAKRRKIMGEEDGEGEGEGKGEEEGKGERE